MEIEKKLSDAYKRRNENPRSRRVDRIHGLAALFGTTLSNPEVLKLRHQLMTLSAAAHAGAERRSAQRAFVIVQEFVSPMTTKENRARNAQDLDCFLKVIFGFRGSLRPGHMAGPFVVNGRRQLYYGKTQTVV